jgi:hypothetical protein
VSQPSLDGPSWLKVVLAIRIQQPNENNTFLCLDYSLGQSSGTNSALMYRIAFILWKCLMEQQIATFYIEHI